MEYGKFAFRKGLVLALFLIGVLVLGGQKWFPGVYRLSFFLFLAGSALAGYLRARERLSERSMSEQSISAPGDWSANSERLVRDPVCGLYLAEGSALPLQHERETLHFCSAGCREEYRKREGPGMADI